MNGLLSLNPRLRTQGPNIANTLLLGQQIKEQRGQRQFQNQLLQQQSERQQTQFGWAEQDRPLEKRMIALRAALLSPNPKDRQAIFESFGGEGITFSPEAKGMEFRLSDGTEITVPKNAEADVREYIETGLQDPSWFTDETKANQAAAFLVPKGVTVKRPVPKETNLAKLQRERDEIATQNSNDPRLKEYDAAIAKATQSKGVRVSYDSEGRPIIEYGSGVTGEVTKKTAGAVEEKIIAGREQISRMEAVKAEFKPEYQEIQSRLGATWTSIKAKLGRNVSKQDRQFLVEFKRYQRKAIENINLYIKELTGAQMSEKEADRLRLAQPDPGEKWYKGDDPITFEAKMGDVIKSSRAAVARYNWYKKQGLDDGTIKKMVSKDMAVPLENMRNIMKTRLEEISKTTKEMDAAKQQLMIEFGL